MTTQNVYEYWPDWAYRTCNCACSRCMAGGCCMWNQTGRQWTTATIGTADPGWACTSSGHDFAPLGRRRLFCRKCGETRDVK